MADKPKFDQQKWEKITKGMAEEVAKLKKASKEDQPELTKKIVAELAKVKDLNE